MAAIERLTLQMQFGQLPGPGIKGHARDSWHTVVRKDWSARSFVSWVEEVQACQRQASREMTDCHCMPLAGT